MDIRGSSIGKSRRARGLRVLAPLAGAVALAATAMVGLAAPAGATSCSTTTGATACTINASLTVTAGTLTLEAPANLYWGVVQTGYDQWASASSAALSSCVASGAVTHCTGGAAPVLEVLDATGSGNGWAVSEYLSSNTLPTGSVLTFDGAGGSTYGYSQVSAIGTDPYAGTTPASICDYASTCTAATAATTTCSHSSLGFSTCPSYPVTLGGTSATTQVDLYSAAASSGLGAICFASGTASATGCSGATPTGFFNLGVKGSTVVGTYSTTVNVAVNSGP